MRLQTPSDASGNFCALLSGGQAGGGHLCGECELEGAVDPERVLAEPAGGLVGGVDADLEHAARLPQSERTKVSTGGVTRRTVLATTMAQLTTKSLVRMVGSS